MPKSDANWASEQKYMKMALALAEKGRGRVSPNPLVGAVIVKGGRVVGRGWHEHYGGRHAEANAIIHAGKNASGADLYVTLEPCNHYGKQPPCTKAILESGIKRVFAAIEDPHAVSNKGADFLRKKGVPVNIGICAPEAQKQNEFYIKSVASNTPFVTIKIAMAQNGYITYGDGKRKGISHRRANEFVQNLRARHDAILVGLNTILKDDPKLSVRKNPKLNPVRIILDSQARTPLESRVLQENGQTIIACTASAPQERVAALERAGAKIVVAKDLGGEVDLNSLMENLHARGINSVLIEPGNITATGFLSKNLFDRIIIIVARRKIKEGMPAFSLKKKIHAKIRGIERAGPDIIITIEK